LQQALTRANAIKEVRDIIDDFQAAILMAALVAAAVSLALLQVRGAIIKINSRVSQSNLAVDQRVTDLLAA